MAKNNRGGARPGSGAPKKMQKKVTTSIRLDPDIYVWVKTSYSNVSKTVNELLRKEKDKNI